MNFDMSETLFLSGLFFCKKLSGLIWFKDFTVTGRNAERFWDICRGLQASAKDYQVKNRKPASGTMAQRVAGRHDGVHVLSGQRFPDFPGLLP